MPSITLHKSSLRRLDESVMKDQLAYVVRRMLAGNRGRVWSSGKPSIQGEANGDGAIHYTARISLKRTGRKVDDSVIDKQVGIFEQIADRAGRGKGWSLQGESSSNGKPAAAPAAPKGFAEIKPSQISTDLGEYFSHLFERDHQVKIVHSALQSYVNSGFEDRFHCVLHGPPACGKTEVLRSFARMLGEDAVLTFDATSTTKAGAERTLLETAQVPPVLIVEEIEKTDEHSLRWLLGVLDHRAEIRKVTHRMTAAKSVKLLCLATVNDMDLFKRAMDGALASRFTHKIHCPRPSRAVLKQILSREIERAKGDVAWIDPALDWCEKEGTNDPRRAIAVCLCGREKLLSGEYQKSLAATLEPEKRKLP